MEYTPQMKNRLKRIEGQIRGVLKMMEEGKDCRDLVIQMSAARSAMDRAIALIVGTNLEQCVREQLKEGQETDKLIQEAVNLLVKSR